MEPCVAARSGSVWPITEQPPHLHLSCRQSCTRSVDAADISATLPKEWRPRAGFDRIVWNFPCVIDAGAQAGADARVRGAAELEQNRLLVGRFFSSAAALLTPACGEVGGQLLGVVAIGAKRYALVRPC